MLVLTRKQGESVWLGDVQVWVISATPGRVKLAFDAPEHVRIVRDEIKDKKENADDIKD